MENAISLIPTRETTTRELASMIARKVNFNPEEERKPVISLASGDERFTRQQPETISLYHGSGELESAIETIIHWMYKDALKLYEQAKKEVNCDDEPLLNYHIFNDVDYVARSLFPKIKFA